MAQVIEGRPGFDRRQAAEIARRLYGRDGDLQPLPSDRDLNYRLTTAGGERFVLKFSNREESLDVLGLQRRVLERLAEQTETTWPRVVPTTDGEPLGDADGHAVRLLTWIPGRKLADVRPQDTDLLVQFGRFVGRLDRALLDFEDDAAERVLAWDLRHSLSVVERYLAEIPDPGGQALVSRAAGHFAEFAEPKLRHVSTSVIHNDANDHNVLVDGIGDGDSPRSIGLIDFGDLVKSWTVSDLAIAATYVAMHKHDPLGAIAAVVAGYHQARPLDENELGALHGLIRMRLCTSVCMSAYQQRLEPDNAYLSISEVGAWDTLARFDAIEPELAECVYREACGIEPCAGSRAVVDWIAAHASEAAPVVAPAPATARSIVFDLSVGSPLLGDPEATSSAERFTALLFDEIERAGAELGIGRYDEARDLYASDTFVGDAPADGERRTVHLGVDLFLPAGAPVFAPYDGTVLSAVDNDTELDYGPTLILRHEPADGPVFHTLYGHLGRDALEREPGSRVARGQRIASLGDIDGNGGWPPHLHFQLIADTLGRSGDFPGVAAPRRAAVWRSLSPDPRELLGIAGADLPDPHWDRQRIAEVRRQHAGPSLSLSYRAPLQIVKGRGTRLIDADGRRYLDCVNNVAHVGHCHPRIVRAAARQNALLNTNTRYLHEALSRYTEALTACFDERLTVCFLVNSGSEANDLALRLARTHTGRRDVVCLGGAYHGNLSSLIEVSPYKFEGPGGATPPSYVHPAPLPDPYRGRYRDPQTAGALYADEVGQAAAACDGGPGAFVAEALLGCGGQIVPPAGFLAQAFEKVRGAGGVCIADEVQIGFGRVGSQRWGFETQGAVPDIVTLGKPIGNGHPIGAVVTTAAIAASFHNGMEYFNTYGGNPVSCAVGLEVLRVIDDEGLQQNALRVGARLKQGLAQLAERHTLIGDVRGLGLYLGVELVEDRESRTPAAAKASYVVNRAREEGVLLSTDGRDHNVIKIKPPIVFSEQDADLLVETLDLLLGEDYPAGHGAPS